MFYLILVITFISLIIYSIVSFYPSNRSAYDRREQNVELFKAEKKNLELSTNLSQESLNLLVNEREQILLQDIPKEKELVVVTWVDILQTADWTPAGDVTIPTMQSVGWFISRDEKEIKIGSTRVVQSADDPQGTPFSITAFPIGCVEEIKSI